MCPHHYHTRPLSNTALHPQLRADDFIDAAFWNQWVDACMLQTEGPCSTAPLSVISAPLVSYNGVPIGPTDSMFKGWVSLNEFGLVNVCWVSFVRAHTAAMLDDNLGLCITLWAISRVCSPTFCIQRRITTQ